MAKGGCIFCGAKPLTREHLFPLWLTEIVRDGADFFTHEMGARIWTHPKLDMKVKCVCGPCNWGWMHELEDETAPVLTPLIRGETRVLTEADQTLIARWAAKTAVVISAVERRANQVPAELRAQVREQSEPPRNVNVSLYAYGPKSRAVWYSARVLQMESKKLFRAPNFGYLHTIALSVGHFVAHVGIFPVANMTVFPPEANRPFYVCAWPSEGVATWPPEDVLGDAELDMVVNSFLSTPEDLARLRRELDDPPS